ncbi:glycosyltransferase family 1 protein [Pseudomonas alkylphenolica]|uniref:Glycosyltransferase family 1 protein n=1 Tax=Pseudomonas alkylphenolica TaxID=237609 RepID=A0A443ZG50_9PSED|nr:glycosyltransferase family 1 protein [Pseudomonas alkylphenolica]RWU17791.1 glycosyltransferase family 1 protein [Pseudomonas alkylphenolica]
MRLLLNTESLRPPLTGIGNYTLNLLDQLHAQAADSTIDCFDGARWLSATEVLDGHGSVHTPAPGEAPGARELTTRFRSFVRGLPFAYRARSAIRSAVFRREASKRKGYIYHEPNFILKPHAGPCVATIHDLSFVHYPHFHPAERVEWLNRELPRTLARADYLITDSEIVRQELIERYNLSADVVRAIYLGADKRFIPRGPQQTASVLTQHGLEHGRYVAFVGTLEPRKGLAQLLDAWSQLPNALRRAFPLVIAGAPGWRNSDLLERIQAMQARGEVKYLRFVCAEELPLIYSGAAVFAYPSVYEGFGLPVLEAMASGVPVVCTSGTSMAEFAQGAAALHEPGSSESLAFQLSALLEDEGLRDGYIHKGLLQAQKFSWERCARETLDVYRSIG